MHAGPNAKLTHTCAQVLCSHIGYAGGAFGPIKGNGQKRKTLYRPCVCVSTRNAGSTAFGDDMCDHIGDCVCVCVSVICFCACKLSESKWFCLIAELL